MFKKHFLVCSAILTTIAITLCGCNNYVPVENYDDADNSYYADTAQTELEYKLYINKKIAPVLSKIIEHASTALNIAKGEYDAQQEITNVDTSIELIKRNREEFSSMRAAKGYESVRENVIRNMDETLKTLYEYKNSLNGSGSEAIKNFSIKLKNIYTVLSQSV